MGWAKSSGYFEKGRGTTKESFLGKENNFRYEFEYPDFSRKDLHRDKIWVQMG
jgi:hypothetical protein